LFVIAVVKDVICLLIVNAFSPIVARQLAKWRRCFPTQHRYLPLEEFALEDSVMYFFDMGHDEVTTDATHSDGEYGDDEDEALRDDPHMANVFIYRATDDLMASSTSISSKGSLRHSILSSVGDREHLLSHRSRRLQLRSSSSLSCTAFVNHPTHSVNANPRGGGAPEKPPFSHANLSRTEYCRDILLPALFKVERLEQQQLQEEAYRIYALMLSQNIWIDILDFPERQDLPKHDLENMPIVIQHFATRSIVVFTSMTMKGRVGHTLDTYISPAVLIVLIVTEMMAWSVYTAEVVKTFSSVESAWNMFELISFRAINSGAISSLSLLAVKYFLAIRISASSFKETRSGSLPPVAAATYATLRYTKRIHILTWIYFAIEVPMVVVGFAGMVLYPLLPALMLSVALFLRLKLSPIADRSIQRHAPKLFAKTSTRRDNVQLVRVLVRFVVEQQIPALALAISMQACANYLLLFCNRELYRLTYWGVVSKEFLSRSASCFERQLGEDFSEFVHRSAGAIQWLTALFPGA
jgi:hypothetical protein